MHTMRYITVTIDMGLFCRVCSSDAVAQQPGEMEYPDVFNLSIQENWGSLTCDATPKGSPTLPPFLM